MAVRYNLEKDEINAKCTMCGCGLKHALLPYILWWGVEEMPEGHLRICATCVERIASGFRLDLIEIMAILDMRAAGATYDVQLTRQRVER